TGTIYVARSPAKAGGLFDNFLEVFSSLTGRRFSDAITPAEVDAFDVDEILNSLDMPLAGIRKFNFAGAGVEIEGPAFDPSGIMYVTVAQHDEPLSDDHELYAFTTAGDRPL